ncbi:hypothetical protein Pth03_28640 [Planotetraspora thailandica]|uniref:Uncharacterized protein n=1 Tax=Planotetraspora thailandica TaxID=487172 RepID=A0A8J3V1G2_9ACTN|nr:hypothetical protein [Planotetraspora thailandica]GII54475.1 hypothetical protein Pth03_28640 [Planotetraspora thailandica]
MTSPGTQGYRYVGPADLAALIRPGGEGRIIRSAADLDRWMSEQSPEEAAEPYTFVIGADGVLRLAPRRSEHVACDGDLPGSWNVDRGSHGDPERSEAPSAPVQPGKSRTPRE